MKKKKIVGGVAAGIAVGVMVAVWITMFVREHEDILTAPVVGIMALQAEEGTAPTANAITINFWPLWTPEPYGYLIYELTVVVTGLPPEEKQTVRGVFTDLGLSPWNATEITLQENTERIKILFIPPVFLAKQRLGAFFWELAVEIVLDPLYNQPKKTPKTFPCPLIYYPSPRDPFLIRHVDN